MARSEKLSETYPLTDMDRRVLTFLVENGGEFNCYAIPNRLFIGTIPEGHPGLHTRGLIEHGPDDLIIITPAGRKLLESEGEA